MVSASHVYSGKVMQRILAYALAPLYTLIRLSNALSQATMEALSSIANLPPIRRSRLRHETLRLWRRLVLMTSDGYNFEEFFRTQYGLGEPFAGSVEADLWQLPGQHLLDLAHNLEAGASGVTAMRVLVERAVRRAENSIAASPNLPFVAPVKASTPHGPNIHERPRPIEMELTIQRPASSSRKMVRQPSLSYLSEQSGYMHQASLEVEDAATFELSVPQLVPYRASTRH